MRAVGHIVGFVALLLFIFSYQLKEKRQLLVAQTAATALLCLQYLLLDASSGFGLNIVCILRNVVYYYRDKKIFSGWAPPLVLAGAMAVVGAFSWEGYHSLFILFGLMINTVCMGVCNQQNLRKSVVLTCSMLTMYNLFAKTPAGAVNEMLSVVSAVVGILRYRKEKTEEEHGREQEG